MEYKCPQCGAPIEPEAAECKYCGEKLGVQQINKSANVSTDNSATESKSKIAAGLLALFLGTLGIHKFYLGYKKEGLIMLLVTVLGSFVLIGPAVMGVIALIEAIIYLTKSEADFNNIYVKGHKGWF